MPIHTFGTLYSATMHSSLSCTVCLPDCLCVQSVIDEASSIRDWVFLHSLMLAPARRHAVSPPIEHEAPRTGTELELSASIRLASILIASQSDYFVGALQSSATCLIHDLRLTNGRLFSGLLSVTDA